MPVNYREREDDPDIAAEFALAGLGGSTLETLIGALSGDALALWKAAKAGSRAIDPGGSPADLTAEGFRALVSQASRRADFPGLRLNQPLGLRGGGSDLAREILADPGYQAAGRVEPWESGLAAFSIGASSWLRRGKGPAFTWPLQIHGARSTLEALAHSKAVTRGLAELVEEGQSGEIDPRIVYADIVDFPELPDVKRVLALRFRPSNVATPSLGGKLTFDQLDWSEPTIIFPLEDELPADPLTRFIYGLSHNLPLDVAAWRATQQGRGLSPLVIASRDMLAQARLSDTIPLLQGRLGRLDQDEILPIDDDDLRKFGDIRFLFDTSRGIRVGDARRLLAASSYLPYDRESDSGEGLVAVRRAAESLSGSGVSVRGESGLIRGAELFEATGNTDEGPPTDSGDPSEGPNARSRAPRYTDVTIFDPKGEVQPASDPLVRGGAYTLDVAIRVYRRGLTKDRSDQGPVIIPNQLETAFVWVVITDESEPAKGDGGGMFRIPQRFEKLVVPVEGNSEGSAQFQFVPTVESHADRIGRIGIRLYHKLSLIDHLRLDMRIAAEAASSPSGSDDPAIQCVLKHPNETRGIEALDPGSRTRTLTISVSRTAPGGDFVFAYVHGDAGSGEPRIAASKRLSETELNGYLVEFRDILLDLVFESALAKVALPKAALQDFLDRISRLGSKMVTSLFNYLERDDLFRLWQMVQQALPETSIVQIALSEDAQDFVLPWQILAIEPRLSGASGDVDNLWGYRFIVEVKRCGDGASSPPASRSPLAPARVHYARWNFANEAAHLTNLEAILSSATTQGHPCELASPVISNRDSLFRALKGGGGDLLYVYAHGTSAAPDTPSAHKLLDNVLAKINALEQRIKADTLGLSGDELVDAQKFYKLLAAGARKGTDSTLVLADATVHLSDLVLLDIDSLKDSPVIFVNTCELAQVWNGIGSSFIGLFLTRGARAVVGTESTIPVVFAAAFGQSMLSRLFEGESIGAALLNARRELVELHNNPLGLAYSVYGAADAGLFPRAQSGGVS